MNRLRELREDKDLIQRDISSIIDKDISTYSDYENNVCDISVKSLKKLSNYYDTSIDYILYRTDERKAYPKSSFVGIKIHRLKEIRTINSKTQREVSLDLGIPLKTYIKYENMTRSLNTQILNSLADFYKTSTDYIVCNTDQIIPYEKSKVDWKVK